DVVVVTRRTPGTAVDAPTPEGVRVVRADVDLPWLPSPELTRVASANHALAAAAATLAGWQPDVVHAHDWAVAWAAVTVAAWTGAPLVTTFHGTERSRHGGHLPNGLPTDIHTVEWWLASASARVIATTRLMT